MNEVQVSCGRLAGALVCLAGLASLSSGRSAALGASAGQQEQDVSGKISLEVGKSREFTPPWPVKGVSLGNPLVADVQVLTPELLLFRGTSVGTTDVFFWSDDGETERFVIQVHVDLGELEAAIAGLLPGADLRVVQAGDVMLVSGTLAHAVQAEQLHKMLDLQGLVYVDATTLPGTQQVQVLVTMAEVSRTGLRQLGINAFGVGNDFFLASTIGSASGGPIAPVEIVPGGGLDVTISPAVTLFGGATDGDYGIFMQALEEDRYVRILAEPNLVALSGEEASFLAGGEFPIPVVQGGGVGTSVTIEFKEFGVALRFRPLVLGDGRIRLQVGAEVSELSDIGSIQTAGFLIPSIVTRRVETTLEMHSGQTFVMAGLISEVTNAVASRTPWLGDLPILGALFRSVRYQNGETELVLMVTVSLVQPLSAETLAPLPGSVHVIPSAWEVYTEGRREGRTPARLSPEASRWLKEMGLDRLKGPGAWATHETTAYKRGDSEE